MSTSQCFVNPWTTIDFHVSGFRENLIGILQDSCTFKKNSDKFHHTRPYFLSNSCPLNKYLRIVILKRIGKSEIKNWFHIIINKDNYGMYFAIKGQTLQQDLVNNLVILYHNEARICMFHRLNTLSNLFGIKCTYKLKAWYQSFSLFYR